MSGVHGEAFGDTDFGFHWGPMLVQRTAEYRGTRVLRIITEGRELEIAVSPAGQSIRAWLDGVPMVKSGERQ